MFGTIWRASAIGILLACTLLAGCGASKAKSPPKSVPIESPKLPACQPPESAAAVKLFADESTNRVVIFAVASGEIEWEGPKEPDPERVERGRLAMARLQAAQHTASEIDSGAELTETAPRLAPGRPRQVF